MSSIQLYNGQQLALSIRVQYKFHKGIKIKQDRKTVTFKPRKKHGVTRSSFLISILIILRIPDCIEVLEELNSAAVEFSDSHGRALYMCCCFDLILEAGNLSVPSCSILTLLIRKKQKERTGKLCIQNLGVLTIKMKNLEISSDWKIRWYVLFHLKGFRDYGPSA